MLESERCAAALQPDGLPHRESDADATSTSTASYVYLLTCSDKTLYTGWTTDPQARLAAHNAGRGAKYTRGRLPVSMVYVEALETKSEALKREAEIKKLPRAQKLALIERNPLFGKR